jgi:putative transposase
VKTDLQKFFNMSKKLNYITTNRSKHYLKIHLIFVCKYRKPLLIGILNEDMKTILENIANNSDFNIEVMESDINHIHFLIRYIPRLSVSSIVRKLKQESTKQIWSLYSDVLSQEFWLEKTFWSDGYFVSSIGEASPETIREYILNQG